MQRNMKELSSTEMFNMLIMTVVIQVCTLVRTQQGCMFKMGAFYSIEITPP